MSKLIASLALLISASNVFAYIYAPSMGDKDMDELTSRMQQQDTEDRLNAIESRMQSQDNDKWQKDLFDSMSND